MGDCAEMMIDGILDEHTGEYLGDTVGYPRHRVTGQDFTDKEKKRGIFSFFGRLGITKKQRREILMDFYPGRLGREQLSNESLCIHASEHFKDFHSFVQKWMKQNKAI